MFIDFADTLQKARNHANRFAYKCSCPDCTQSACKSHLIQKHPVLESIANSDNKLFQIEDNWEDARSGRNDIYSLKCRGINDAMQYPLFCSSHDTSLFQDLEKRNSLPASKVDCLLLAYRSACSVRLQEEHRLHLYEYCMQKNPNDLHKAMLVNSKTFLKRMDAVIGNLWKAIYGEDDSYMFRMIAVPHLPVAASDCIVDEEDFEEHLLEEEYTAPFNCYFINLIPGNDKLFLLLGCDTRYDRNGEYQHMIDKFPVDCDMNCQVLLETIWGLLILCHNWCCSPDLLNNSSWKSFFKSYEKMKANSILRG